MKVKVIGILICLAFSAISVNGQALKNEVDSLSYALGVLFGKNIQATLQSGGFDNIDVDLFVQTFLKAIKNESVSMTPEQANMYVNEQYMKMQQSKYEPNLVVGREFLEKNKKEPGVVALPSGLQYKIITAGTGEKPTLTDKVTVHYHGTLLNGTVFDSSVQRGQPIELPVNGVIQGWIEALQLMPVGSKWMLYIPSELAYGSRQSGMIEPNSTLIFEVELISINN